MGNNLLHVMLAKNSVGRSAATGDWSLKESEEQIGTRLIPFYLARVLEDRDVAYTLFLLERLNNSFFPLHETKTVSSCQLHVFSINLKNHKKNFLVVQSWS